MLTAQPFFPVRTTSWNIRICEKMQTKDNHAYNACIAVMDVTPNTHPIFRLLVFRMHYKCS